MEAAIETTLKIGQQIEIMGRHFRILRRINREQFCGAVEAVRVAEQRQGRPLAHHGVYHPGGKRFQPGAPTPPEHCYCYLVEEVLKTS